MRNPNGKPAFAKKSLGQNFLTDPNYIRKIIDAVTPSTSDVVVEIGPGRGALTELLVDSGARVIAIELDPHLGRLLSERFENSNFQVIEGDVLEFDFGSLSNSRPADLNVFDRKLVGNLPYYISTAIVQLLARHRQLFSQLVLMFQREVVERIVAKPADSQRGFLTVVVEAAFEIEELFDVPPTAFSPRPKIWSSVVRLVPKPKNEIDERPFLELVSNAFGQKRKTLLNNLKLSYPNASNRIEAAGIDVRRRAETLSIDEWVALYRSLVQS